MQIQDKANMFASVEGQKKRRGKNNPVNSIWKTDVNN